MAGASEGRVISESEHQRGRAIPSFSAIQGEGHTSSRIFNEYFCDVIFHLLFFLFNLWHIIFSEYSCPFPSVS